MFGRTEKQLPIEEAVAKPLYCNGKSRDIPSEKGG
jgi:hypothetical protein